MDRGGAGVGDHDLVVVGGGPVGASLACALGATRLALVGRKPVAEPQTGSLDARVYALSPGNVAFLHRLGAWQRIEEARVLQIHAMRIYGDRPGSVMHFDAYGAGVPELAWIVEDAVLQRALWQEIEARANVHALQADLEYVEAKNDAVHVTLRSGEKFQCQLVVAADGAESFVRRCAGIAVTARDYGQSAVVANFSCEKPHRQTAYQWFSGGAVLALLPLPGDRVSMVWSLPSQEAARVAALDPESLCREVERSSCGELGALAPVTPARSYVLKRLSAARLVAPRVALVGDAAHVIHPLAGQGLNLGLQDVRALARVLEEREAVRNVGDLRLLRRYERERAEPILAMQLAVDGLFRLFGARANAVGALRNGGLNLTDRLPVLKNLLMRHAMR